MDRPNLVFVLADQLRHGSLGYAGDPLARTPDIDAFAATGVDFTNAVATAPVCAGMRAAMLTGTYPTTNGMVINELRLHPAQRCLGHVLRDGGYDTAYIGKWHLYANELGNHADPKNSFVPRGPYRLGFDGYWAAYNFHHRYFDAWYHTESPEQIRYGPGVYEPDGQTELAIAWIRGRAAARTPFALFLSWGPPHDPWDDGNVPEADRRRFDGVEFPHPPNYRAENDPYGDFWSRMSSEDRAQLPGWRRNYYAMTGNLDTNLGRLLDAIEHAGIAQRTLVVFSSDHGEMLGAHGRRAKNVFYEEAVRVPFLLRWPGELPSGLTVDACLGTVDIAPTLTGLLGLPAPDEWEGDDLSGVARDGTGGPDLALLQGTGPVAVFADGFEWRAVRDRRYTYATYRVDGSELLFDNLADPFQLRNIVDDPAARSIARRLRGAMEAKMAQIGDTFESSSWYERNWTDGHRNIVAGARGPFRGAPAGSGR
ncbi:MAG: sulfatase [Acidimicrobiia bacterium]|nr:MAG: sulfatase [Acidimicrobiia bacterium]